MTDFLSRLERKITPEQLRRLVTISSPSMDGEWFEGLAERLNVFFNPPSALQPSRDLADTLRSELNKWLTEADVRVTSLEHRVHTLEHKNETDHSRQLL
jgi:hypothetical protein